MTLAELITLVGSAFAVYFLATAKTKEQRLAAFIAIVSLTVFGINS